MEAPSVTEMFERPHTEMFGERPHKECQTNGISTKGGGVRPSLPVR